MIGKNCRANCFHGNMFPFGGETICGNSHILRWISTIACFLRAYVRKCYDNK